jgi:hypothetical protein
MQRPQCKQLNSFHLLTLPAPGSTCGCGLPCSSSFFLQSGSLRPGKRCSSIHHGHQVSVCGSETTIAVTA